MSFWWSQVRVPLALLAAAGGLVAGTDLDVTLARAVFFESPHTWIGAGQWWATTALHDGGRWLIRMLVAAATLLWVSTFFDGYVPEWRRPAAYFALAVILTVGIAGALKAVTNVDCPWDLAPFGGQFPYVHLFADRPDVLRHARCFPAAHASSGYALMSLYFVLRERSTLWARAGLTLGIATGLLFGIAQQARGAHFVSHDLCSAVLAWTVSASLYALPYRCRLWTMAYGPRVP
jgi:membrane-associated PAP2 superfamily phosphatase